MTERITFEGFDNLSKLRPHLDLARRRASERHERVQARKLQLEKSEPGSIESTILFYIVNFENHMYAAARELVSELEYAFNREMSR